MTPGIYIFIFFLDNHVISGQTALTTCIVPVYAAGVLCSFNSVSTSLSVCLIILFSEKNFFQFVLLMYHWSKITIDYKVFVVLELRES